MVALLALTLTACGGPFPKDTIDVGGHSIKVEVAATPDLRARGLMYRDSLPADRGMLFIYPDEAPRGFWMKNTRIPLDILYFDEDLKLVSVSRNVPTCSLGDRCPNYPSRAPAFYVLELNAGVAAEIGVAKGDELKLGPGITERGAPCYCHSGGPHSRDERSPLA